MRVDAFRLITVVVLAAVAGGCTNKGLQVDLKQERQQNLQSDLYTVNQPDWNQLLQGQLTLDRMLEIAKQHNLEYMMKELEAKQADDELAAAHLAKLPKGGVSSSGTYETTEGYAFSKNRATGTMSTVPTTSAQQFKGNINVSLQWSILDYGISYYRAKQKVFARQIVDERKRRALEQLALNLVQDYMRVAVARQGLAQADQALAQLEKATARMKKLAASQEFDKYVALQYEGKRVALDNAKETLRTETNAAMLRLAQTMGVPPGTDFEIKLPAFSDAIMPDRFDVNALVDEALHNRPELYEADLKEHITREEVKSIALQRWPNLGAVIGMTADSNKYLYSNVWGTIGTNLSWDLLSIPQLNKTMNATEKRADVLVKERQLLAMSIMAEVHLAYADYMLKGDRYRRMKKELDLHNAMLDLARSRASVGKLSNVDLIAHEAAAVEKTIQLSRAYADWIEALQKIYYATQQESVDGNGSITPRLAATSYIHDETISASYVQEGADTTSTPLLDAPMEVGKSPTLRDTPKVSAYLPKGGAKAASKWRPTPSAAAPSGTIFRVFLAKPDELSEDYVGKQLEWLRKNGYPDAWLQGPAPQHIVIASYRNRDGAEKMVQRLRQYNLNARIETLGTAK